MPNLLLSIANFLHLLATVTWIGGLVLMRLVVQPALAVAVKEGTLDGTQRRAVHCAIARRLGSFTFGAIVLFIISGLAMLSRNANFAGILSFSTLWAQVILLKHAVVAVLIVTSAYQIRAVSWRLSEGSTASETDIARWQERHQDLADVNLLLGVVVLGLTAVATSVPVGG